MTKKDYLKPAMTVTDIDLNEQILAGSVLTTGLGGDNLTQDGSGDSWGEALSRGSNVWFDEAEEDW
jgi:hypothetical protein